MKRLEFRNGDRQLLGDATSRHMTAFLSGVLRALCLSGHSVISDYDTGELLAYRNIDGALVLIMSETDDEGGA